MFCVLINEPCLYLLAGGDSEAPVCVDGQLSPGVHTTLLPVRRGTRRNDGYAILLSDHEIVSESSLASVYV